ncbi:uncharacterized protein LOC121979646 [Zingiber officinale]|uniref:uncharacterized protein LOC121979646 n=1 Tax=Zingiber officinale TaxID=94328 RepID=UPI001C4AE26C|nr:uncharacterized protein LOC121979646 [Zingiber officinale]
MAQLMEQHAETIHGARPEMVYEHFRKINPRDFIGTTNSLVVEGWIRSIEVIFKFMALGDVDKMRCATYLLKVDVLLWWEGAELSVDMRTLLWNRFKEVFYAKYFIIDIHSRLKREFMSLRQGDLSVVEYLRKFDQGCHFLPLITNDASEKLRHFMNGLRSTIHRDIMMVNPFEYSIVITRAFRAEQTLKDINFEMRSKRPPPEHNSKGRDCSNVHKNLKGSNLTS